MKQLSFALITLLFSYSWKFVKPFSRTIDPNCQISYLDECLLCSTSSSLPIDPINELCLNNVANNIVNCFQADTTTKQCLMCRFSFALTTSGNCIGKDTPGFIKDCILIDDIDTLTLEIKPTNEWTCLNCRKSIDDSFFATPDFAFSSDQKLCIDNSLTGQTPKCQYYNDQLNTVCQQCQIDYMLNSTRQITTECISAPKIRECARGFFNKTSNFLQCQECLKIGLQNFPVKGCLTLLPNCQQPETQATCQKCVEGYSLNINKLCVQAIKDCIAYDEDGLCFRAISDKLITWVGQNVVDDSLQITGCLRHDYNSKGCSECTSGLQIDKSGQFCVNQQQILNCAEIIISQEGLKFCGRCDHGYFLGEDYVCVQMEGCLEGKSDRYCTKCQKGYFLSQNFCIASQNNVYCSESKFENTGQQENDFLINKGQCTACQIGFEMTTNSEGICVPQFNLNSEVQNCEQYGFKSTNTLMYICIRCMQGFAVNVNGDKCLKNQIPNCLNPYSEKLSENEPAACSTCIPGFALYAPDNDGNPSTLPPIPAFSNKCFRVDIGCLYAIQNGNCAICERRYYLYDYGLFMNTAGVNVCLNNDETGLRGCKVYESATICKICYSDYFTLSLGKCNPKILNCLDFITSTKCKLCQDDYILSQTGGSCIAQTTDLSFCKTASQTITNGCSECVSNNFAQIPVGTFVLDDYGLSENSLTCLNNRLSQNANPAAMKQARQAQQFCGQYQLDATAPGGGKIICSQCQLGFKLNTAIQPQEPCQFDSQIYLIQIDYCIEYFLDDQISRRLLCSACDRSYSLIKDRCFLSSNLIDNCKTHDYISSSVDPKIFIVICSVCEPPYLPLIDQQSCQISYQTLSRCISTTNLPSSTLFKCNKCVNGYVLGPNDLTTGTSTCIIDDSRCFSYDSKNLPLGCQKCVNKLTGVDIIYTSGPNGICFVLIENCAVYEHYGGCKLCEKGYIVHKQFTGYHQCDKVNPLVDSNLSGCIVIQDRAPFIFECVFCDGLYFLNSTKLCQPKFDGLCIQIEPNDSLKCRNCQQGYRPTQEQTICALNEVENCRFTNYNPTQVLINANTLFDCFQCNPGYSFESVNGILNQLQCLKELPGCLELKKSNELVPIEVKGSDGETQLVIPEIGCSVCQYQTDSGLFLNQGQTLTCQVNRNQDPVNGGVLFCDQYYPQTSSQIPPVCRRCHFGFGLDFRGEHCILNNVPGGQLGCFRYSLFQKYDVDGECSSFIDDTIPKLPPIIPSTNPPVINPIPNASTSTTTPTNVTPSQTKPASLKSQVITSLIILFQFLLYFL